MNSKEEGRKKRRVLKELRQERNHYIETAKARVKEQRTSIKKIRDELNGGGKTVPEIAEGAEMSPADVLWYLMALKKYGRINEGEKEGGYFKYHLVGTE